MVSPYSALPDRAFWSRAAACPHATMMQDLFRGVPELQHLQIATAGSCFAQHIGRALRARKLRYMDYEPAPAFLSTAEAEQLGYGVYSCRYGNVYTVRQLWQLFLEAFGQRQPGDIVWTSAGRFYDALRPGIEKGGFGSAAEVLTLRQSHLARVRALFTDLDLFVFTLGLTEAWVSTEYGTVFPTAPGVIANEYDPARYHFENFRYPSIREDMLSFIQGLRGVNPKAQVLLTVSPVPLAATATDSHVLVATTYSKSVLRAVAGDLAADLEGVYYFPSFEIITGQPSRHMYYNSDLRTVARVGVDEVMRHFFAEEPAPKAPGPTPSAEALTVGYEQCEEALLDSRDV